MFAEDWDSVCEEVEPAGSGGTALLGSNGGKTDCVVGLDGPSSACESARVSTSERARAVDSLDTTAEGSGLELSRDGRESPTSGCDDETVDFEELLVLVSSRLPPVTHSDTSSRSPRFFAFPPTFGDRNSAIALGDISGELDKRHRRLNLAAGVVAGVAANISPSELEFAVVVAEGGAAIGDDAMNSWQVGVRGVVAIDVGSGELKFECEGGGVFRALGANAIIDDTSEGVERSECECDGLRALAVLEEDVEVELLPSDFERPWWCAGDTDKGRGESRDCIGMARELLQHKQTKAEINTTNRNEFQGKIVFISTRRTAASRWVRACILIARRCQRGVRLSCA